MVIMSVVVVVVVVVNKAYPELLKIEETGRDV
jgi:hypothetical protein